MPETVKLELVSPPKYWARIVCAPPVKVYGKHWAALPPLKSQGLVLSVCAKTPLSSVKVTGPSRVAGVRNTHWPDCGRVEPSSAKAFERSRALLT